MGKRSKKVLTVDVATAACNLGEALNDVFAAFMDNVDDARLRDLETILPIKETPNVMDVIIFTSRLAAKVKWDDIKFTKLLDEYSYSEEMNKLILMTYPLTKKTEASPLAVVHKDDVESAGKESDSLVGEFATEEIRIKNSGHENYLKYYGQDTALLEIKFNVNALGSHEQISKGDAERMDAMASMVLILPKQNSVLSAQYMFELTSQLTAQGIVAHLRESEAYKNEPEKTVNEFKGYVGAIHQAILDKTLDLFEGFKFIEEPTDTKGPVQ